MAALTFPGNLFFDYIFQALYFTALGIVLQAAVQVYSLNGIGTSRSPASGRIRSGTDGPPRA